MKTYLVYLAVKLGEDQELTDEIVDEICNSAAVIIATKTDNYEDAEVSCFLWEQMD